MRAKDIMEPIKGYLSPEDTLKEAVNKMRVTLRGEKKIGVKGLVVLDKDQTLIGIISIIDILRAIIPHYMSFTELSDFTWDGMLEEMAKKVADKKIKELMTKEVITVYEDAPLMECAILMVKHNLQRIPVINKDRKVLGMIYIRDLYYAIVKALFDEKEVENNGS